VNAISVRLKVGAGQHLGGGDRAVGPDLGVVPVCPDQREHAHQADQPGEHHDHRRQAADQRHHHGQQEAGQLIEEPPPLRWCLRR